MKKHPVLVFVGVLLAPLLATFAGSPEWNQFRGPNGSGVLAGARPPVAMGPDWIAWSIEIAEGHSSPVLGGEAVYLTAVEEGRLVTLAIDRDNGKRLWQQSAPEVPLEPVHQGNSPASSTPCTDANSVYVYFGSYGLLCYSHEGEERWKRPIPTPQSMYGMSTSPILHGDHLYLFSATGTVTVVPVGESFHIRHQAEIGEGVVSTPALDEDTLYLRTKNRLIAFRDRD